MYRVIIYNGDEQTIIHEPGMDPSEPHLYECSLVQGSSGEIDSLSFTILPGNPGYERLYSHSTFVEVVDLSGRVEASEFSGRVLSIAPQMEQDGLVYKSVVCEDRLGYLCDSIQPYTPKATYTVRDFLTLLLDNHNAQVEDYKKIYVGEVSFETSSGNVTKSLNYQSTWDAIKDKLLSLGGEIMLYTLNGLLYLDYVTELGTTGSQTIEIAKNMRTLEQDKSPVDIITRLIPLGDYKDEQDEDAEEYERINIESVNGGKNYLDDEDAQAAYGIIAGTVIWEDVTEPENLLAKGRQWLEEQTVVETISLSALDLYEAGLEPDTLQRFNYYRIYNPLLNVDKYYRVAKVTRNVLDPTDVTYDMGSQSQSLSSTLSGAAANAASASSAAAAINANLSKTVTTLIAGNAIIQYLQAEVAEIEAAYIDYAEVERLLADYATIQYLEANYIDANTIEANYIATSSEWVTNLDAFTANITTLLSGQAGVGELQTIHLTAENVVIDSAVIMDLIAEDAILGTLLAGKIYTDFIEIMDNDDQSLYITGSVIQFKDADGVVRMQIGLDASGYWNYYILDSEGNVIFDALGLTEAGLVGNGAIIRNDAVADDAAISGYKLDIQSVTQYLNEYGGLTMEAAQVTIDGERLDYKLTQITEMIATGTQTVLEFYQSDSPTELIGGEWSTEQPQWEQGKYIWMRQVVTHSDETVEIGVAVCITGNSGDGVGIDDVIAYYAVGDSATEAPGDSGDPVSYMPDSYYSGNTYTNNGVMFTKQSDGSVIANGTAASSNAVYVIIYSTTYEVPAGSYEVSGGLSEDIFIGVGLQGMGNLYDTGEGLSFRLADAGYINAYYIIVSAGTTCDNVTIYPTLVNIGNWQRTQPEIGASEYLWMRYKVVLTDGTIKWLEPCCLTDDATRKLVSTLQTELSVVQGQISAKIWETDIETALASYDWTQARNYALLSGGYKSSDDPEQIIHWYDDEMQSYVDAEAFDGYLRVWARHAYSGTAGIWWGLSSSFTEGELYTASVICRGSGAVGYVSLYAVYQYGDTDTYWWGTMATGLAISTDWTTVTVQWTPQSYSGYTCVGFGLWVDWSSAGNRVDVQSIMVETGDAAHSWTRAPEDYALSTDITILTDRWAEIVVSLDSILAQIGELQTIVDGDFSELTAKVTSLELTVDGISADVYAVTQRVSDDEISTDSRFTSIEATVEGLQSTVSNVQTTISGISADIDDIDELVDKLQKALDETDGTLAGLAGDLSDLDESLSEIKVQVQTNTSNIEQTDEKISSAVSSATTEIKAYVDEETGEIKYELSEDIKEVSSQIEQLADSITLSVTNGTLGETAQIKLSVSDRSVTQDIDLTKVREAFANDNTAITISAGAITFASGMLIITSGQMILDASGNATFSGNLAAPTGTIGGWIIGASSLYSGTSSLTSTTNGLYLGTDGIRSYSSGDYLNITSGYLENGSSERSTRLTDGYLRIYYGGSSIGSFAGSRWTGTTTPGLAMHIDDAAGYAALGRYNDSTGAYSAGYVLNNGLNPGGYEEPNILYGRTRFDSRLCIGDSMIGTKSTSSAGSAACLVDDNNVGWCMPYINYQTETYTIDANTYQWTTWTFPEFPTEPFYLANASCSTTTADITARAYYISRTQCQVVIHNASSSSQYVRVVVGGIAVPGWIND